MCARLSGRVKMQKLLLRLLAYLLIGYVCLLLCVRIFQSRLIFFPNYPGRLAGDWHPSGLPVEDVSFVSSDGVKLHAWWIPNGRADLTFLAFHGNAGNIADRAPIYEFLRQTPANVLALEYRGYGHSEGSPSEAGFYRDADAAYQFLTKVKNVQPQNIISYGQSLGTTVAVYLAARHKVGAVILEAPFPSGRRVARTTFRFLAGLSLLIGSQFDTKTRLQTIEAPLMIVHCTQDPVIPFSLGEETFDTAREPKTFLAIESACHEEASIISPEKYRSALRTFLNRSRPVNP